MNGLSRDVAEAQNLALALAGQPSQAIVVLCPPATLLGKMDEVLSDSQICLGGQNCHTETGGAFTGEISAAMLADAGAKYVILGHSERRTACGETNRQVRAKAAAAIRAGLEPVICIGETLQERSAGKTLDILRQQLAGSIPDDITGKPFAVAYEPVWAIGGDRTPSLPDIVAAHAAVRALLVAR